MEKGELDTPEDPSPTQLVEGVLDEPKLEGEEFDAESPEANEGGEGRFQQCCGRGYPIRWRPRGRRNSGYWEGSREVEEDQGEGKESNEVQLPTRPPVLVHRPSLALEVTHQSPSIAAPTLHLIASFCQK